MIWISSPLHRHSFQLEREAYAELPKQNTPYPSVMWGQIEKCSGCEARRFNKPGLRTVSIE